MMKSHFQNRHHSKEPDGFAPPDWRVRLVPLSAA
jgi:hypothetical protein